MYGGDSTSQLVRNLSNVVKCCFDSKVKISRNTGSTMADSTKNSLVELDSGAISLVDSIFAAVLISLTAVGILTAAAARLSTTA